MLGAVFRRGIGAYRTNPASVRPNVRSEEQWAYARVNAFFSFSATKILLFSSYQAGILWPHQI